MTHERKWLSSSEGTREVPKDSVHQWRIHTKGMSPAIMVLTASGRLWIAWAGGPFGHVGDIDEEESFVQWMEQWADRDDPAQQGSQED